MASTNDLLNPWEFKFSKYHSIGFELNHTLVRYKLDVFLKDAYFNLLRLVPWEDIDIFDTTPFYRPIEPFIYFLKKGVILDMKYGNFLYLSDTGLIINAAHGTRFLKQKQIQKYYGENCRWDATDELIKNFSLLYTDKCADVKVLIDYIDIVIMLFAARLVDTLDDIFYRPPKTYHLHKIDDLKRKMWETSGFFTTVQRNFDKYIYRWPHSLKNWLKSFRGSHNLVLYILTDTPIDYSRTILEHCVGGDWLEYFDFMICEADKPNFYTNRNPIQKYAYIVESMLYEAVSLRNVGLELGTVPVPEDVDDCIYLEGSWVVLHKYLKKIIGNKLCHNLLISDNMLGDIIPGSIQRIDVLFVCEELEAEGSFKTEQNLVSKSFLKEGRWGTFMFSPDNIPSLWCGQMRKRCAFWIPSLEWASRFPINYIFVIEERIKLPTEEYPKYEPCINLGARNVDSVTRYKVEKLINKN